MIIPFSDEVISDAKLLATLDVVTFERFVAIVMANVHDGGVPRKAYARAATALGDDVTADAVLGESCFCLFIRAL
jgi:hypothetical protein